MEFYSDQEMVKMVGLVCPEKTPTEVRRYCKTTFGRSVSDHISKSWYRAEKKFSFEKGSLPKIMAAIIENEGGRTKY